MKKYCAPLTLMSCLTPHPFRYIGRILDAVDSLRSEHWFFSHGFDISDSIYLVNSQYNKDSILNYDIMT